MPWFCTSAMIANWSPCAGAGREHFLGPRNVPPKDRSQPTVLEEDFDVATPVENNPPAARVNPPSRPQPRGHFVQLSTPTAFTPQPINPMLDAEMPTTVGPAPHHEPAPMQQHRPAAPPVPTSMRNNQVPRGPP